MFRLGPGSRSTIRKKKEPSLPKKKKKSPVAGLKHSTEAVKPARLVAKESEGRRKFRHPVRIQQGKACRD